MSQNQISIIAMHITIYETIIPNHNRVARYKKAGNSTGLNYSLISSTFVIDVGRFPRYISFFSCVLPDPAAETNKQMCHVRTIAPDMRRYPDNICLISQ